MLLNSRLLDYYFQRLSVPFRGEFKSANKQFIAPLPIRLPTSTQAAQLEELGERLHVKAAAVSRERAGFLAWLAGELGTDPRSLPGSTTLLTYDRYTLDELIAVLGRSATRLRTDPDSRRFRELLAGELEASLDRLAPLRSELTAGIDEADGLVYELYEIPAALRDVVEREYEGR